MFSKLSLLATSFLVVRCIAQGTVDLCCESLLHSSDPELATILALLGLSPDILGDVGIGCTPLFAFGPPCSGMAVTCSGVEIGSLIYFDCVPFAF
ncbi:hypothetical protein GGX14DRAFT_578778 [Mycena pura]|uniref:Hydrophobin n=1 Tax=Mycena pura TaxID=153505 RepID=A0AAD6US17_9AGAR|nr:hypothetical protein GGX14DRAFT_578778 [Mycena pura]